MGILSDRESVLFSGWVEGADNVSRETAIAKKRLRLIQDADVDNSGHISTREGYTLAAAGNVHSVWTDTLYLYAVVNGVLTAFDVNLTPTPIQSGIGPYEYLTYASVNGYVYWSSGGQNGRFDAALVPSPIGLAAPGTPLLSAVANGALDAGLYQVAVTATDVDGTETGAASPAVVSISASNGITVAFQGVPAHAVSLNVYMSDANGAQLYLAGTYPAGTASVTLTRRLVGKILDTEFLTPMLPGTPLFQHGARVFAASGPYLWFSEPFKPGYTKYTNYLRFPAPIACAGSFGSGPDASMVICAGNRTYLATGVEPQAMARRVVRYAGGVPGSMVQVMTGVFADPDAESQEAVADGVGLFWIGTDGQPCLAMPGGAIQTLTPSRAETNMFCDWGATLLRASDGLTQIVSTVRGGTTNALVASDSAVATVYKQASV